MAYRRPQPDAQKYLPPDFISVPMPNEKEVAKGFYGPKKKQNGLAPVIHFIKEHVRLEELILIGLIILLLDEAIEDDLLLILLVYILLF